MQSNIKTLKLVTYLKIKSIINALRVHYIKEFTKCYHVKINAFKWGYNYKIFKVTKKQSNSDLYTYIGIGKGIVSKKEERGIIKEVWG